MQLVSFRGNVHSVGPVEKFGQKEFPVQRVVVERATGCWQVDFSGDSGIELAESLALAQGDIVDLECDLRCREWQKPQSSDPPRYFLSLNVIGARKGEKSTPDGKNQAKFGTKAPTGIDITKMEDVPF